MFQTSLRSLAARGSAASSARFSSALVRPVVAASRQQQSQQLLQQQKQQRLVLQRRWISSLSGGQREATFDPTNYKERALPAGRHPLDPIPPGFWPKMQALKDVDRPSAVRMVRAALWIGTVTPPAVYLAMWNPDLAVDIQMWALQMGLPPFNPQIWIPFLLAEASWPVRSIITFYLFRTFYAYRDTVMRPF